MRSGPSPPVSTSAPARPKICDGTVMSSTTSSSMLPTLTRTELAPMQVAVFASTAVQLAAGVSATLSATVNEPADCGHSHIVRLV